MESVMALPHEKLFDFKEVSENNPLLTMNKFLKSMLYITRQFNSEFTNSIDINKVIGTIDRISIEDNALYADLSINYLDTSGLDVCCKISNGHKYRFDPKILVLSQEISIINFNIVFEGE